MSDGASDAYHGEDLHVAWIPDGNRRYGQQWASKQVAAYEPGGDNDDAVLRQVTATTVTALPDYLRAPAIDYLQGEQPRTMQSRAEEYLSGAADAGALGMYKAFAEADVDRITGIEQDDVDRLLAAYGHSQGVETAKKLPDWTDDRPIDTATLWGLSVDNAEKRPDLELFLLNITFAHFATEMNQDGSTIHEDNVQVNIVGDTSFLADWTTDRLDALEADTAQYDESTLNVALGYGGRRDVTEAAATAGTSVAAETLDDLYDDIRSGELSRADATARMQEAFSAETLEDAFVDAHALPEIDILMAYGPDRSYLSYFSPIHTVGYAHLAFPGAYWPDATAEHLDAAVEQELERDKTRGA